MGIGEVEDMLIREQKRKDDRRRKKLVKERQLPREGEASGSLRWRRGRGAGGPGAAVSSSSSSRWVDALVPDSLSRQRRRTRRGDAGDEVSNDIVVVIDPGSADEERPYPETRRRRPNPASLHSNTQIEMTDFSRPRTPRHNVDAEADEEAVDADVHSITTATTESVTDPVLVPSLIRNVPFVPALYTSCVHAIRILRRAHVKAARAEVGAAGSSARTRGHRATRGDGANPGATGGTDEGWGLGNFGLREREEAERRIREFQEERRRRMLIPPDAGNEEDGGGWHDVDDDDADASFAAHDDEGTALPRRRRGSSDLSVLPPPTALRPQRPSLHHHPSDPGVDDPALPHPLPPNDSLFWKWGPLRRWRLQDRTTY